MIYVGAVVVMLALVGLLMGLRAQGWNRRANAIRALLDGADALEAQLHDYKTRMLSLRASLTKLPSAMSAPAMATIDPDAQVKTALREVLAHRLWIKQESGNASQQALDNAVTALRKSRDQLEQQLKMLDQVAGELAEAGKSLKHAYQEATAAIAAMPRKTEKAPGSFTEDGQRLH